MRRQFASVAVLGTAAATLYLAGCGGSTSPQQTAFKSLSASQQATVESEAMVEVEANVSSFATTDPYAGFGFQRVAPRRGAGLAQILGSKSSRPRFQSGSNCNPTLSGNQTDEDNDGIDDNLTATFSCSSSSNGTTVAENGSATLADPTPTTADLEYNLNANLTITETGSSDGDLSLSLKGTSALTQGTGTLNETGNLTFDANITNAPSNGNGSIKLTASNNATYTFSGNQPVVLGSRPDGTFNLTGNWNYNINSSAFTANLSFSVSTPGGLSIMNSCTNNSGNIESGTVVLKFADGTQVTATYANCPATPTFSM